MSGLSVSLPFREAAGVCQSNQDGIKIGAHNTITLYGGVFAQENVPEIRCNIMTGHGIQRRTAEMHLSN